MYLRLEMKYAVALFAVLSSGAMAQTPTDVELGEAFQLCRKNLIRVAPTANKGGGVTYKDAEFKATCPAIENAYRQSQTVKDAQAAVEKARLKEISDRLGKVK